MQYTVTARGDNSNSSYSGGFIHSFGCKIVKLPLVIILISVV
jgi:hypothetical protein